MFGGFSFYGYWVHDPFAYSGNFDTELNSQIQDFFIEVAAGSGRVEVGGFPGGMEIYNCGAITFVVDSERTKRSEYLHLHLPSYDKEKSSGVFGDFKTYDGVVPACFSFETFERDSEANLKSTYRLGENDDFDRAFLGFVEAFDRSENRWSDWGGAFETVSGLKDKLLADKPHLMRRKETQAGAEQAVPPKSDRAGG